MAVLHVSARPAFALQMPNIRYAQKLAQESPVDFFRLSNFGNRSLKEIRENLANLGLTLGMTLEDDTCRAAGVTAVAAKRGAE